MLQWIRLVVSADILALDSWLYAYRPPLEQEPHRQSTELKTVAWVYHSSYNRGFGCQDSS